MTLDLLGPNPITLFSYITPIAQGIPEIILKSIYYIMLRNQH